jgi:hypothetical protein
MGLEVHELIMAKSSLYRRVCRTLCSFCVVANFLWQIVRMVKRLILKSMVELFARHLTRRNEIQNVLMLMVGEAKRNGWGRSWGLGVYRAEVLEERCRSVSQFPAA